MAKLKMKKMPPVIIKRCDCTILQGKEKCDLTCDQSEAVSIISKKTIRYDPAGWAHLRVFEKEFIPERSCILIRTGEVNEFFNFLQYTIGLKKDHEESISCMNTKILKLKAEIASQKEEIEELECKINFLKNKKNQYGVVMIEDQILKQPNLSGYLLKKRGMTGEEILENRDTGSIRSSEEFSREASRDWCQHANHLADTEILNCILAQFKSLLWRE